MVEVCDLLPLHSSLEILYCHWRLSSGAISRVLTVIILGGQRAATTDPVSGCLRSDRGHPCQTRSKRLVAFVKVSASLTAVTFGLHFAFSPSTNLPSRPRLSDQPPIQKARSPYLSGDILFISSRIVFHLMHWKRKCPTVSGPLPQSHCADSTTLMRARYPFSRHFPVRSCASI